MATQPRLDDFKFVSGRLSLDLVATLGSRGCLDIERLKDESDLSRWLCTAGLLHRSTPVRPADLREARSLREAIHRAVAAGPQAPPDPGAVRLLNRWARKPSLAPQIAADGSAHWGPPQTVVASLSTIARD